MVDYQSIAPVMGRLADRLTAHYVEPVADWLRPAVRPGGAVLNVGVGTGTLAAAVADALGAFLVVLNPAPPLLSRVPKHARVRGQRGYAKAIPYPDDSFDAVVAPNTFHNLSDPQRAVGEFFRVVRPGGRVVVLEFAPSNPTRPLVWFERLLGGPESLMTPDDLCALMAHHGIEGECTSLGRSAYRFLGVVTKAENLD